LGQVVLEILKLITFGGFGFWVLIDLFLIAGTTREKNLEIARSITTNNGQLADRSVGHGATSDPRPLAKTLAVRSGDQAQRRRHITGAYRAVALQLLSGA